jgi:hypothetical protein
MDICPEFPKILLVNLEESHFDDLSGSLRPTNSLKPSYIELVLERDSEFANSIS